MNRINELFKNKKRDILSIFFTAGFPNLINTESIIKSLSDNNVDLIEIGIPYSDPLADGPTIQASSEQALLNGMTLETLFSQLKNIRKHTDIPLILMGYFNVVLKYGINEFCKKCEEVGIDGVILPDLPVSEFIDNYKTSFDKHDIKNIYLITPQTSDERIRYIDSISNSFIYMVSTAATTGARDEFDTQQISYFKRIENLKLKNPKLIGFGISNNKTFSQATSHAEGAIIGSAFVKSLSQNRDIDTITKSFISKIISNNK